MLRRWLANPVVRYYRDLLASMRGNSVHATARIAPGAMLRHSVVDEYASIGHEAELFRAQVGRYTYVSFGSRVANCTIGGFCSIGRNVVVAPGRHPLDRISTHPIFYSAEGQCATTWVDQSTYRENGHVDIGPDVWIGLNAVIVDDIRIGAGAVIAAGAVVVSDVEPYSIVGGIPAKHLRYRFDEPTRAKLLASKWWHKTVDELRNSLNIFGTEFDSADRAAISKFLDCQR